MLNISSKAVAFLLSALTALPVVAAPPASAANPVQALIERYSADHDTLWSVYTDPLSPTVRTRMAAFDDQSREQLTHIDFAALDEEGKVDYLLFANHLTRNEHDRHLAEEQWKQTQSMLPFASIIFTLEDARRRFERPAGEPSARQLVALADAVAAERKSLEEKLASKDGPKPDPVVAWRAAEDLDHLHGQLHHWFEFSNGYDPVFTWWTAQPYKQADEALKTYSTFLREKVAGIAPDDHHTVIGTPVGREALLAQLDDEMIPYTPEELIDMARKELDWSKAQMIAASRQMGFGDDWRAAMEKVKNTYVAPGEQPTLIRDLALDGEAFAEKNDFVTVPPLAKETWRMDMMTPEQQLVNPFFTGGDTISVSYPTDTMKFDERMMSMRGNNPGFSHATVYHELIPGHWLQEFMGARYRPYRQLFSTGFWIEGNAFYWEMLYWDHGYNATPEQRIGALFWRMHRCARIIFSLSFQLGKMTPQQAIDLLVNEVGHERDNATAEVRRSVNGSYDPLYQCAYMVGALQFYSMHHELVDSGKMTDRTFNDAILHENTMPLELLHTLLTKAALAPEYKAHWRFLDSLPQKRAY